MQSNSIRKYFSGGFWLSVLLHVLLLLSILKLMSTPPEQDKSKPLPHTFVPAYTYKGSIKPSSPHKKIQNAEKNETHPETSKTKIADKISPDETPENIQSAEQSESTLEVPKILKHMPVKKTRTMQKSLIAASFGMLQDEQLREISQKNEAEPIYMIGDDSMPADPLIKLMGRSLSAHFRYPQMAGQLGIRGRVLVKFILHPEGYYSHVQMIQSSNNEELDAAALYAVNSAPRIVGADRFLPKAKQFTVGFLFN